MLNQKQKKFCKYVAQGISIPKSAIKAGYSETTANTKAHKWIGKSEVADEIERLKNIVQKVADNKFAYDIETSFKKLNEIQEIALQPNEKGDYCNLNAAIKAEELKGKMYGIYEKDNTQKQSTITNNINGFESAEAFAEHFKKMIGE